MDINKDELHLLRQWFNAIKDIHPLFIEDNDRELMEKIETEIRG